MLNNEDYTAAISEISERVNLEDYDNFQQAMIFGCDDECNSIDEVNSCVSQLQEITQKKHKAITVSEGIFRVVLDETPCETPHPDSIEYFEEFDAPTHLHDEESHIEIIAPIANDRPMHRAEISDSELLELARQKIVELDAETPEPTEFQKKYVKGFEEFDAPTHLHGEDSHMEIIAPVANDRPIHGAIESAIKPKFSFNQFSITDNLDAMKTQMLNDVFVLDGIALLGQLSVFYAKPNTGKTLLLLWMLTQSIKAGRIKGENVFYINADDTYKGLITKGELAKKYGFSMIAPSFMDFKVEDFKNHLRQLIADDSARGVIIVLDTLKKFTDLMDKKKGSEFMKLAREFASNGGTMLMMAHTNKNRSLDGKVVAGGTSDITDDCDCAYTLDEVQGNSKTHKDVLFENIKSRGNVKKELLATYSIDENIGSYHDLLNSVQIANSGDIEQVKKERDAAIKQAKDKDAIEAITDAINQGNHKRLEIVDYAMKAHGVARRKAKEVIDNYTGTKLSNSSLWRVQVGEKNSQIYYLLKPENVSANDYEMAKNG
jgi:archaellum biogenesis ATPase FlaH